MDFESWYRNSIINLGGTPYPKYNPCELPHVDLKLKPITLSPEVIEFMKEDAPIHCPHLQLLAGCMNCEYDELYKYCRCTKPGQEGPCVNVLTLK